MKNANAENRHRLDQLEAHLHQENPTLLRVVKGFRTLDRIAKRTQLMPPEDSFATQVPWYPVISLLGTFSAGKSSFVNYYLGHTLQRTGNQAVDDKFTVICHAADSEPRVLPGSALDADPRLPFYRVAEEIDKVAPGEGKRIDSYLQLKTCTSDLLNGKILIDSPGFDADEQRSSVLRLTDHILHLSDLVLVFFDARHPEPGAMRDTLSHLVAATRERSDATKFLYVLNQIDTTAREDNLEEVFASWQRALASNGLTTGRFYCISNPNCSVQIDDPEMRARMEHRRDSDLRDIIEQIRQVEVGRAYRIVDALEETCLDLRDRCIPAVEASISRWRKLTWVFDALLLAAIIGGGVFLWQRDGLQTWIDRWKAFPGFELGLGPTGIEVAKFALVAVVLWFVHTRLRKLAAFFVRRKLRAQKLKTRRQMDLVNAFDQSTRTMRPMWMSRPAGWTRRAERKVQQVLSGSTGLVQALNDGFAQPSGHPPQPTAPTEPEVTTEAEAPVVEPTEPPAGDPTDSPADKDS